MLFNEEPGTVKGFLTVNYEGTQARITENMSDAEYYNNESHDGWFVSSMITNLQETEELEFKGKEEKWFTSVQGVTTELENLDTKEFSVQGIGNALNVQTTGIIQPENIPGCTDDKATNYNALATTDDGSCQYAEIVSGCTDSEAINYNPLATLNDGSCIYCVYGCMDTTQFNYNPLATCDDETCIPKIFGCTDPNAFNYYAGANTDNGGCIYESPNPETPTTPPTLETPVVNLETPTNPPGGLILIENEGALEEEEGEEGGEEETTTNY